jgi:3'(2'), 5'-bisphosphate nucleotidase
MLRPVAGSGDTKDRDMTIDHRAMLELARAAALDAGAAILRVYADNFAVEQKADASPVTLADQLAEKIVLAKLGAATPDIPVVAEEQCAAYGVPGAAPRQFWLVDPLDGTKEFIKRNDEFTVNIALIESGRPVLGVVHLPAQDVTYAAGAGGAMRWRGNGAGEKIAARAVPQRRPVVVHSRSHADEERIAAYLAALTEPERRTAGSSLKFCLIAAGEADLYPRLGRTMEWDTAAGQAVLEAAGGSVATLDGAALRYGKPGFSNPDFIARGR